MRGDLLDSQLSPAAVCVLNAAAAQVHLGLLEGRALAVIWPPSRMGWVDEFVPAGKLVSIDDKSQGATGGQGEGKGSDRWE